jgi:hypothetical protein
MERDALAALVKRLTRDVVPVGGGVAEDLLDAYRYTPLNPAEAALVRRVTGIKA